MKLKLAKAMVLTLSVCMLTGCTQTVTTSKNDANTGNTEAADVAGDNNTDANSNSDGVGDNSDTADDNNTDANSNSDGAGDNSDANGDSVGTDGNGADADDNSKGADDNNTDTNGNSTGTNSTTGANESGTKANATNTYSSTIPSPNLSTNKDILSFIAGEWTLTDKSTGEDYGTITFKEDGSCTFTRLEDDATCDGKIEFSRSDKEGENPEGYSLTVDEIGDFLPNNVDEFMTGEITTGGLFHIGIGDGEDYLYLSEKGNGDTWISGAVFNKYQPDDFMGSAADWMFYRKNDIKTTPEPLADDEFYAFAWGREKDGSILIQKMIPYEFETYDEYTDRAFTAAYFIEDSDVAVRSYELEDSVDTGKFLHEKTFDEWSPLYVYSAKTDSEGKISDIKEVDDAFYGMYDMGNLEPVIEFENDTFYYNNSTYKLGDFAPGATAITDCKRAGDYIVVECHVNPHYGVYAFFNIYYGDFVYSVMGANLIWKGDDLSTAVYTRYNEIYDFWDNLIGSVYEGEVMGLSFEGDDKLVAECWKVEGEEEKTFNEEFEYEPVDHDMFNYIRYYASSMPSRWRTFIEEAPENAVAFVIENPQGELADLLGPSVFYEDGAQESVTVIPLVKNAKVSIEPTESDISSVTKHTDEVVDMTKGQKQMFTVSIAEVKANDNLIIQNDDGKKVTWPIELISGRVPQRSTFVSY